jgi:hypothetical protein
VDPGFHRGDDKRRKTAIRVDIQSRNSEPPSTLGDRCPSPGCGQEFILSVAEGLGMTNFYFCRRRGISPIAKRNIDLATPVLIGYAMPMESTIHTGGVLDAAHIYLDSVISGLLSTEL